MRDQLSLLAILVTLFRKSFWVACKTERADFSGASGSGGGGRVMEIGWPTDVHHVNHVTFDRFNGFLGLPVEFEPEVSRRAPSARFSPADTNLVLREFEKCGVILKHIPGPREAKWMHILYQLLSY